MDHEYELNANVVSSALSKDSKFKGFDADQAAELLVRLIKRGDKKLLPDLLRAAVWADGALAEIIGDEASELLLDDTVGFVEALTTEPESVRMEIYHLIENSAMLTPGDKRLINGRLHKVEKNSPLFSVARELRLSTVLT